MILCSLCNTTNWHQLAKICAIPKLADKFVPKFLCIYGKKKVKFAFALQKNFQSWK